MNLLIVDDYPNNRKLLRAALEAEGHRVAEASDGVEALDVLGRDCMDAVISDILMPRMDGFRLCREIRKGEKLNCGMPVVLYTATYNSPSDRELAQTVGADCYLLKPAPTAALLDAVREAQQKARRRPTSNVTEVEEAYVLEQYSAALVRKLDHRNSELQEALVDLQDAHEHILALNRNLETRVTQRTAALAAANEELEAFSFSVSHDLRAPLLHIDGFAQLLQESTAGRLDEKSREYLEHIVGAARRMGELIQALLTFARTSRAQLNLADVDLEEVLEGALAEVRGDTQSRNIQWQRGRLPKARGDATLLGQVFVNVIANAIKYTRTRYPAVIEIGARPGRADEVVVFVRDNGVGFDLRYADRLFGVFQRLHRADEFEGTGIGLANAHRIVTRHGGAIWAEAAVDRGATFFFSLPRAESV
jgi:signal transduction histidine kinase